MLLNIYDYMYIWYMGLIIKLYDLKKVNIPFYSTVPSIFLLPFVYQTFLKA